MKDNLCRFRDSIGLWIIKLLNAHKGWLFAFAIVFLVAFITGIMTCVYYLDIVTYENLINKYLINLLTKESTYLGFFLMMSMWFLIVVIFSIWFTKNMFFVVVDFLLIAIMSYILGFDICIIVMTLGLAGVIYGILILGVLGVLLFFIIMLIMSIVCKKYFVMKNICDSEVGKEYLRLYVVLILIGIVVLFIMSLFFSSIHIFVIVE